MHRHLLPLLALLLAPQATLQAADARKPNIIVILADDLGYADLGCRGSKDVISPHMDSLAANGVRCTAGYVSAPQCCPSRAGLRQDGIRIASVMRPTTRPKKAGCHWASGPWRIA